ncbi:MAG TPA: PAS domain-containing protein [Flavisolibacter sp.]|nr:PAS domain-containing protein [Flavisolibacter sp.]
MLNQTISLNTVLSLDFTLFEASPGMRFVLLPDTPRFTIVAATKDMCKHTGRSREQLIGKGVFEVFPSNPADPNDTGEQELKASLEHVLLQKESHQLPNQRYDIQDQNDCFAKQYWSACNIPILSVDGDITHIIHSTESITEKIKAEAVRKKIREMEQAHNLFLQAPVPIQIFKGPDLIMELANEPTLNIWGKGTEIIGKTLSEAIPEFKKQGYAELLSGVIENGKPYNSYETPVTFQVDEKKETRYFNMVFQPYYEDESTKASGAIVFSFDVTQKVLAQRKDEENEQNFRNTILQMPVAIGILTGPQFIVEVANQRMYELWGRSEEELLGMPIFEGLPEVKDQGFEELLKNVFTTGERFTAHGIPVTLPRKSGIETIYIDLLYEAYRKGDGTISGVIAVATDVTEQVIARMKIDESHRELQFIMDVMPQMVWHAQPDGTADLFNQVYQDYTGLTMDQLKVQRWMELLHPEDRAVTTEAWQRAHSGVSDQYMVEHRLRGKDGVYNWFLTRGVPLKNSKGMVLKWYGTSTNVQEQKLFEEQLEKRVKERTQELEQFTYVSHHDLQEPLRKIIMFADLVKSDVYEKLSPASQNRLDKVTEAALRMSQALRDVLNFASLNQEEQFIDVNLDAVLSDVSNDLELVIQEKGATIHLGILPTLKAIPTQMHQLFYNLVCNALKFSKKDGLPVINIRCKEMNAIEKRKHTDLNQSKQYCEITVEDNGIGINEDATEKIFIMFQRLHHKNAYAGTGIGLALCKKVVTNHDGKIWAESKEGKGATFHILLPTR